VYGDDVEVDYRGYEVSSYIVKKSVKCVWKQTSQYMFSLAYLQSSCPCDFPKKQRCTLHELLWSIMCHASVEYLTFIIFISLSLVPAWVVPCVKLHTRTCIMPLKTT
jgi:hypothetical protein